MRQRSRSRESRAERKERRAKGARRIVIDGAEWLWRCTGGVVQAWGPAGARRVFHPSAFGVSSAAFERGQHKGTSDGMITPKMVERAVRGGGSPQAVTLEDWHRALAARKIAPTTFVWDEQGDRLHLLAFDFYGRRIAVARFVASFIMSCGAADTGEFIPGDEPGAVIDRVRDRIRERVRVGTL